MIKTVSLLVGMILAAGVGYAINSLDTAPRTFQGFNPTGGNTYLLQSSISSTQTSVTLTSFLEPVSNLPYTMTYINTDIIYGTIAPSSGNSEFVSATGITQNANGTATLTGVVRGLARTPGTGGCVASTTLAHAYPGQTQFILSNSPCFYSEYAVRRNPQTITGRWNFTLAPTSVTPTTSAQVATKGYVDGVAVSGAPNADETTKGIVEIATTLEAASSTSVGGTGARLVASTATATDTPTVVCNATPCQVWTKYGSKTIRQTFIDLTEAFTVSGLWTFTHPTTTVQNNLNVATTSPLWGYSFNVGGKSLFTGGVSIGNASTTMANGTLVVSGLSTTTRLTTSNPCNGCIASTTWAIATVTTGTNNADVSSATATCGAGKIAMTGGVDSDAFHPVIESYPSTPTGNAWTGSVVCSTGIGACGAVTMTVYAICISP